MPDYWSQFLEFLLPTEPSYYETFVAWLYRWQTLVGAGVAFAGAFATVLVIRQQIDMQRMQLLKEIDRQDTERLKRERRARLLLPHALSSISAYLEDCFVFCSYKRKTKVPLLASDAVRTLVEASEDIDAETFQTINELVVRLQILATKCEDFASERGLKPINWQETVMFDVLYSRFFCDRLYSYGRGEDAFLEYVEPTADQLRNCVYIDLIHTNDGQSPKTIIALVEKSLENY